MERKTSTGSGITVHREILVHTDEVLRHGVRSKSVTSICTLQSRSPAMRSKSPDQSSRQLSPSPARNSGRNTWYGGDSRKVETSRGAAAGLDGGVRSNDDESLRYLVDFLKTEPPPANNRMSIPDPVNSSTSSDGGPKWSKTVGGIRVGNKRQQGRTQCLHEPHRPPLIRLPDSAVAATTTGGFRHIAISIPLEHSYLRPRGEAPRIASVGAKGSDFALDVESQLNSIEMRLASVRVYSSENGTGSALKPVAEARESSSSERTSVSPRTRLADTRPISPLVPLSKSDLVRSPDSDRASLSSPKVRVKPPTIVWGPTAFDGARESSHPILIVPEVTPGLVATVGIRVPSSATGSPTTNPGMSLIVPERKASKQSTTSKTVSRSIASMLSSSASQTSSQGTNNGGSTNTNNQHQVRTRQRGSGAESVLTVESEPLVLAQPAKAYHNTPVVVRPPSQHDHKSVLPSGALDPLHSNAAGALMSRSVQTDTSMFTPLQRALSRKEKVRERKQKDVESMKGGKHSGRKAPLSDAVLQNDHPNITAAAHDHRHLEFPASCLPGGLFDSLATQGTTSAYMPEVHRSAKHSKRHDRQTPRMDVSVHREPSRPVKRVSTSSTESSTTTSSSSSSSSSHSSAGSSCISPHDDNDDDQIAHHRQQKKTLGPEACHHHHHHHHQHQHHRTPHKTRHATEAEEQQITEGLSRLELLRRYGKLKESRLCDLERRLRRLEHNGDMCLLSMVPLMESINATLDEQRAVDVTRPLSYAPTIPRRSGSLGATTLDVPRRPRATMTGSGYEHSLVECHIAEDGSLSHSVPSPVSGQGPGHTSNPSWLPEEVKSSQEHGVPETTVTGTVKPQENTANSGDCGQDSDFQPQPRVKASRTTRQDKKRDADRGSGLEMLEPLMRELQEAAKLIFGDSEGSRVDRQAAELSDAQSPQLTDTKSDPPHHGAPRVMTGRPRPFDTRDEANQT